MPESLKQRVIEAARIIGTLHVTKQIGRRDVTEFLRRMEAWRRDSERSKDAVKYRGSVMAATEAPLS